MGPSLLAANSLPVTVVGVQTIAAPKQPRRPNLDLELAACVAVLELAATSSGPVPLDLAALALTLGETLRAHPAPVHEADLATCRATNRSVITAQIAALARAAADLALAAAEAEFANETGARRPLRTESSQLAALRRTGLDLRSLDPSELAPYRRRLVVRALERLRRLIRLERHLRTEFHAQLAVAFGGAIAVPRASSIATLATLGVDGQALLEALVRFEAGRHLNLIRHQANKLAGSYSSHTPEDLFGFGYKGLLAALHGYDPSEWAFSTYACTRIVGSMQDGVRQESPIPKRLGTYARQVRAVAATLGQELGRDPSSGELLRAVALERLRRDLGRTPTTVELAGRIEAETRTMALLPRLGTPASLDELFDAGEIGLTAATDPAEDALLRLTRAAVREAIDGLPPEEAEAVRLLDLHGVTLDEAAARTGATTRQLRSRRDRGRAILAQRLAAWV